MTTFTIGSRGSLLAVAQASYIKRLLEENTGHQFNLKIIKTKGDIITDKPLWQLEGKDFFTRELDEALLKKEIDLVVHSFKDLGGERPEGIHLGAVTKRVNPADTLIVTKETALKMVQQKFGEKMILGSSSPRRITQSELLPTYLPQEGIKIENKDLRGNVDTRLRKLLSGEYDGIILAAAGLERISYSEEGFTSLRKLAPKLTFMFLPLQDFVPAPAQGALAIDCHEENDELRKALSSLDDSITRKCVGYEKGNFQKYGGGCHLPMGIYAQKFPNGIQLVEKGKSTSGDPIHSSILLEDDSLEPFKALLKSNSKIFIGMPGESNHPNIVFDQLISKKPKNSQSNNNSIALLATKHALNNLKDKVDAEALTPIFAAGSKSMRSLAEEGYWCNGCSNSQGDIGFNDLKNSQSFNLFCELAGDWDVYTHENAISTLGPSIHSYERVINEVSADWESGIAQCEAFVFTSYNQYAKYVEHYPDIKNKIILSGMGKSHLQFLENKTPSLTIPSYRWIFQTLEANNEK